MSNQPFTAYGEGGADEVVITYPHDGKWTTVVTDKNPAGPPTLVSDTYTETDAKAKHEECLASVKAGRLGEFDTQKVEDDGA